jgi:tRNA-modifying protein YgfZ
MANPHLHSLTFLAPILVTGADARTFLQGQLSNDIAGLDAGISQLASCNSPQGRVQAILTLVPLDNGILLLLPASMAALTLQRLRKYVLRSKVTFSGPGHQWVLQTGTREALEATDLPCPALPGQYLQVGDLGVLHWLKPGDDPHERFLVLGPATAEPATAVEDDSDTQWRLADIRSGLPQVLPETHESFVAQMLNLDLLSGISFDKGCYTGQEIIARTQYRGAIKRRMLRFSAACPPPPPGTRVLQGEQHAGDVVDAAATPAGCELLAVVSLAQRDAALELASTRGTKLVPLPLPYDLGT